MKYLDYILRNARRNPDPVVPDGRLDAASACS